MSQHVEDRKKARCHGTPGLPGAAAIAASGTVWLMAVISVIVLMAALTTAGAHRRRPPVRTRPTMGTANAI